MLLENTPSAPCSPFGTHWEQRLLHNELMVATSDPYTVESYVSPMTLALAEDSGWYQADYAAGVTKLIGKYHHGYKQGCNFVQKQCLKRVENYRDPTVATSGFCGRTNKQSCIALQKGEGFSDAPTRVFGYCKLTTHKQNLVDPFRYFAAQKQGGASEYMDYCPMPMRYSNGDCYSMAWKTTNGRTYLYNTGNSTMCFMSLMKKWGTTLLKQNAGSERPACYRVNCNGSPTQRNSNSYEVFARDTRQSNGELEALLGRCERHISTGGMRLVSGYGNDAFDCHDVDEVCNWDRSPHFGGGFHGSEVEAGTRDEVVEKIFPVGSALRCTLSTYTGMIGGDVSNALTGSVLANFTATTTVPPGQKGSLLNNATCPNVCDTFVPKYCGKSSGGQCVAASCLTCLQTKCPGACADLPQPKTAPAITPSPFQYGGELESEDACFRCRRFQCADKCVQCMPPAFALPPRYCAPIYTIAPKTCPSACTKWYPDFCSAHGPGMCVDEACYACDKRCVGKYLKGEYRNILELQGCWQTCESCPSGALCMGHGGLYGTTTSTTTPNAGALATTTTTTTDNAPRYINDDICQTVWVATAGKPVPDCGGARCPLWVSNFCGQAGTVNGPGLCVDQRCQECDYRCKFMFTSKWEWTIGTYVNCLMSCSSCPSLRDTCISQGAGLVFFTTSTTSTTGSMPVRPLVGYGGLVLLSAGKTLPPTTTTSTSTTTTATTTTVTKTTTTVTTTVFQGRRIEMRFGVVVRGTEDLHKKKYQEAILNAVRSGLYDTWKGRYGMPDGLKIVCSKAPDLMGDLPALNPNEVNLVRAEDVRQLSSSSVVVEEGKQPDGLDWPRRLSVDTERKRLEVENEVRARAFASERFGGDVDSRGPRRLLVEVEGEDEESFTPGEQEQPAGENDFEYSQRLLRFAKKKLGSIVDEKTSNGFPAESFYNIRIGEDPEDHDDPLPVLLYEDFNKTTVVKTPRRKRDPARTSSSSSRALFESELPENLRHLQGTVLSLTPPPVLKPPYPYPGIFANVSGTTRELIVDVLVKVVPVQGLPMLGKVKTLAPYDEVDPDTKSDVTDFITNRLIDALFAAQPPPVAGKPAPKLIAGIFQGWRPMANGMAYNPQMHGRMTDMKLRVARLRDFLITNCDMSEEVPELENKALCGKYTCGHDRHFVEGDEAKKVPPRCEQNVCEKPEISPRDFIPCRVHCTLPASQ